MAFKKMNKEWKKKWISALEGGRYKQGQGALKRNDGSYCCLGVLCNVAQRKWDGGSHKFGDCALNNDGLKLFNLSDAAQNKLIYLNDTERKSFDEIAKWIAKNL